MLNIELKPWTETGKKLEIISLKNAKYGIDVDFAATQTMHTTAATKTWGWEWGSWSPCACTDDVKLLNASLGIRHRVPRCRDSCQHNLDCPKDRVEYQMCACGKGKLFFFSYSLVFFSSC